MSLIKKSDWPSFRNCSWLSDFFVSVENGVLTISSEKKEEKERNEKDYTRQEYSYSSFSRSFSLPENTREDDVNAKYEDGVLKGS